MCEMMKSMKEQLAHIEKECRMLAERQIEVKEIVEVSLMDMPVEILIKILSHLDAEYLRDTISKVCKRFESILSDFSLWKGCVYNKVQGCYPPLPKLKVYRDEMINWEEVCIDMEGEYRKWTRPSDNFAHIVVKDVHYASVDTVLLVNKGEMCVSGGRDRGIAVWNILDFQPPTVFRRNVPPSFSNAKPRHVIHDAHAGWVWDLTTDNLDNSSIIYSASWDNTVKAWDLANEFRYLQTFRCGMSALSVVACDNIVMAGLYSKKILSFDLRCGPSPINFYKAHRGPVLALNCFNNMIASISEDRTLAIWDRTAGKLIKNDIKIPTDKAYPVCINWKAGAIYIGDSKGCLHLFHPEDHTFVKSFEMWPESAVTEPSNKIAGCHQSEGSLIVCSDRGEIKFLYNCNPPQHYCSIQTSTFDVTQLRYLNGVLVTGTCDSALEFWIPKQRFTDIYYY